MNDLIYIQTTAETYNQTRRVVAEELVNASNGFYDHPHNTNSCFEEYLPEYLPEYSPEYENIQLDFWLSGVLLNIVGIVGILGNVLSMVILSRPQMRSSINYLLIGLARCDTVLIVTSMALFGFRSIYPYTGYMYIYNYYVYPQIAPYVFPLAMAAQTASIYLTLMVSLERYVAVCHPLRAVSCYAMLCLFFYLIVDSYRVVYWVCSFSYIHKKNNANI